jgi:hypothetical protein
MSDDFKAFLDTALQPVPLDVTDEDADAIRAARNTGVWPAQKTDAEGFVLYGFDALRHLALEQQEKIDQALRELTQFTPVGRPTPMGP